LLVIIVAEVTAQPCTVPILAPILASATAATLVATLTATPVAILTVILVFMATSVDSVHHNVLHTKCVVRGRRRRGHRFPPGSILASIVFLSARAFVVICLLLLLPLVAIPPPTSCSVLLFALVDVPVISTLFAVSLLPPSSVASLPTCAFSSLLASLLASRGWDKEFRPHRHHSNWRHTAFGGRQTGSRNKELPSFLTEGDHVSLSRSHRSAV
jgi:hypothetical protein